MIAHAHSSRYHSLIPAIKSAIFMGTPHRGSDVANWSKILGQIANVPLLGNIRTDLLEDLRPKSELLMTISSDFVERGAGLSIFSIYERKFIPGLRDLIVDKDSAILNQQNETPLPIEADHRTMCKFLTSSSESYATVFDCLSELYPLLTSIKQALADFISIDAAKGEDDSCMSSRVASSYGARPVASLTASVVPRAIEDANRFHDFSAAVRSPQCTQSGSSSVAGDMPMDCPRP